MGSQSGNQNAVRNGFCGATMTTRAILRVLAIVCCAYLSGLRAVAQETPGWSLIWADEFSQVNGSSPDPARWAYDIGTGSGGWGNNELEYYTSRTNNIRVENGQLVIEARQESYLGSAFTSARIKTQGKVSWRYGRIESRIKIPRGQGIWPAFWMLGTNITSVGWPACGEIDIMENVGSDTNTVKGTIHGPGYSGGGGIGGERRLPGGAAFADDFHVYAVEWTTNLIRWLVDGQQYFKVNPSSLPAGSAWVFSQPEFIILNLAVGGNWPGSPNATTTFPVRMVVDYVRVYAPTNLPASGTNALLNPGFESNSLSGWTAFGNTISNVQISQTNGSLVRSGVDSLKLYGQFTGGLNLSGIRQDIPVVPGQSFTARTWMMTPVSDQIAIGNAAWMEVSFRNAASTVLGLYRTACITNSTPPGVWLRLAVTNQLNPATSAVTGSVARLVAPVGTSTASCQIVFRQPATANGAVYFDDLSLSPGGGGEFGVPVSAIRSGNDLNIGFVSYLASPYQLRWKSRLADPAWTVLTNISGNGGISGGSMGLASSSGFLRVVRISE
jgi:beta-glucanase (GH16 family)